MSQPRPSPLTNEAMHRFRKWCDGDRGRRSAFARHMRYKPQIVTDWFSTDHQRMPTSEQILQVIQFLEEIDLLDRLLIWIDDEATRSFCKQTNLENVSTAMALTQEALDKDLNLPTGTVASWYASPRESRHPSKKQIEAIEKFLENQKST